MFAPGGGSSSTQVPVASKVANSSRITFFHHSQSRQCLASASVWGSNASTLEVSAMKVCSSPSKSSSKVGLPSTMVHTPPASLLSSASARMLGIFRLIGVFEGVLCVRVTPSLDCKSRMMRNGFQRHSEQWSGGGGFGCSFSFSFSSSSSSLASVRLGISGELSGVGVEISGGESACLLLSSGVSSFSPSS